MSLLNLIKLDLSKLPDDSCVHLGEEKNTDNEVLNLYRLMFDSKLMGVFDGLLIRLFDDGQKNYTFFTLENPKAILTSIKLLVNDLFRFYGADHVNNGIFTLKDESSLLANEYWSGRMYPTNDIGVMLKFSYESGLEMTLWFKQ